MLELGIMAEDKSDIDTLVALARRITDADFQVKSYAAKGCGKLKKQFARIAESWMSVSTDYIVVCHDLDSCDANSLKRLKEELEAKVRHMPKRQRDCLCIVIPIQEIEAWLLADVEPLKKRFRNIGISEAPSPEAIASPKEYIEKASRDSRARPRYIHNIHNPELARELDIDKVHSKCPAFRPYHAFISRLPKE
ncbi:MAG: DUF4276 family protein [Syntrophobacteraceae bacterium]